MGEREGNHLESIKGLGLQMPHRSTQNHCHQGSYAVTSLPSLAVEHDTITLILGHLNPRAKKAEPLSPQSDSLDSVGGSRATVQIQYPGYMKMQD
jgi:hypothetical protein